MTKDEINYIWEIRGIKSKTIDGVDNVVYSLTYFVMADYVDGNYDDEVLPTRVVNSQINVVQVPYVADVEFIEYNNLTEETVLLWLFELIDKEEIEEQFFEELKKKYNEKTKLVSADDTTPLPW